VLTREIPFLRICLPLCAGIISGIYIEPDMALLISGALLIITGFFLSLSYNRSEINIIFGLTMSVSMFLCGLILFNNSRKSISALESKQSLFTCIISDFPSEKPGSYLLKAKLTGRIGSASVIPLKGSILLYCRKDSMPVKMIPGDLLTVNCTPVEISYRGNPYEFDYKFYMENHGIRYYAFINRNGIMSHAEPPRRKLIYKSLIIREKIIRMYEESGITGSRLALVAAITLGQKNMLEADQKSYFIKAGVMHLMAVSGLHTGILSLFVFNALFFLRKRLNIIRIILTISILWSFAFVTGLTPSVLRATLMFSFLHAGNLLRRPVNGINSVLASAFVLMLIKPTVIFDTGFLLSYSAVIYIIVFYKDLHRKFVQANYLTDKIWQTAALTIVAQAGTLPLTIAMFNRFPSYFILTNVVIVPLSSLLVISGCLVPLLFPLKLVSRFIGMILSNLAGLTEFLTKEAASLPYASIENIGMTTTGCILFSATIFLFSIAVLKKRSMPSIFPLAALLILVSAGTAREISTRVTNEIIVYNTPGSSTIGIRTGKILNLYSDSAVERPEVKKHCATLGLKIKMNISGTRSDCITAGDTRILITGSLNQEILEYHSPDIVILTGKKPVVELERFPRWKPSFLVIAADGPPLFSRNRNKKQLKAFPLYLVRESGAFTGRI
jgi:competence protein ComEC